MATSADFLGLIHDTSGAFTEKKVIFQPRPALVDKTLKLASEALVQNQLRPTTAGKLLGIRAFLEGGM